MRGGQNAQYVVVVQDYFDNFAVFFPPHTKRSEIVANRPENRFGIVEVPDFLSVSRARRIAGVFPGISGEKRGESIWIRPSKS